MRRRRELASSRRRRQRNSFLVWIIILSSFFGVTFFSYGHHRAYQLLSQQNNHYEDNHRQTYSRGGDQFGLASATIAKTNRRVISTYEDLKTSHDFTAIPYPSPSKHTVLFTPKVSERDCNRPELLTDRRGINRIIWGHLKTIIPAAQKHEHCLSALTTNPLRYEVTEQPLFVAHGKNSHINTNGVVQTENEILVFKRSCFGAVKRKYNLTSCDEDVENLFVASHWWSNETGHFIHETLPRIIPYIDLARQMPIHIRGHEVTKQIQVWFDFLNVTAIHGNICAKNVYVASPSDCRGGAYMSNMHLKVQEFAIKSPLVSSSVAQVEKERDFIHDQKLVLILHRDNSRSDREPIRDINRLVSALEKGGYGNIKVVKSSDERFWSCIPCQMQVFRNTKILISSHGAGLFNMLFMPSGTYVVEIASLSRPEEPYYSSTGQTAYSLGQHYYHYYWQQKDVDSERIDVDFFVSELQSFVPPHKQSFH
ncbi:hypothetical protein ACHAXM_009039 [Skeletonema potamos]